MIERPNNQREKPPRAGGRESTRPLYGPPESMRKPRRVVAYANAQEMGVTPSEGEAMALKAASLRSRSPEEEHEGHESATVALTQRPVEVEQILTPCPQWDPPEY